LRWLPAFPQPGWAALWRSDRQRSTADSPKRSATRSARTAALQQTPPATNQPVAE
jgi:hypothetical protein